VVAGSVLAGDRGEILARLFFARRGNAPAAGESQNSGGKDKGQNGNWLHKFTTSNAFYRHNKSTETMQTRRSAPAMGTPRAWKWKNQMSQAQFRE
jgi:hypothetical protein